MNMEFENSTCGINFILSGLVGEGTYAVNTDVKRYGYVIEVGGGRQWGGSPAQSNGSYVVTNAINTRMKGSYNVTLQPIISTPLLRLVLTDTFDVGLQHYQS